MFMTIREYFKKKELKNLEQKKEEERVSALVKKAENRFEDILLKIGAEELTNIVKERNIPSIHINDFLTSIQRRYIQGIGSLRVEYVYIQWPLSSALHTNNEELLFEILYERGEFYILTKKRLNINAYMIREKHINSAPL